MVNEISPLNCVGFFVLVLFKKGPFQIGLKKIIKKRITLYLNILSRHYYFIGNLSESLIVFKSHFSIVFLSTAVEFLAFVSVWKQIQTA